MLDAAALSHTETYPVQHIHNTRYTIQLDKVRIFSSADSSEVMETRLRSSAQTRAAQYYKYLHTVLPNFEYPLIMLKLH